MPFARHHSLIFGPWCVCREPLIIRSFRPVFDALSLLTLLQTTSCCCHNALVRYELAGLLTTPGAPCALLALLTGARLPAGCRTLVCPSALCLPARALALCCPAAGCRLPAGSRDPAVVTGCPHPSPGVPCPSRMAVASGAALPAVWPVLPLAVYSLTNSQGGPQNL